MKIAVYTIVKNEEKHIQRWADSCKEADYRLIVDTGSTDNTVQVANLSGCHVEHISINPWRFDHARNAAMALLPNDIDMCVSLDADEVLQPGWREALEALPDDVTRPRYKYVWSWNPDGSEGITFFRDHIHRRHGYKWKHAVHEILIPIDGPEIQANCDVVVHHHPDPTKSRSQYLPLLEIAVAETPEDDRNRYYLAREYMFNGMHEKAIPHFLKHLELSNWSAEKSASMRYLATATGNREHWLLRACAESPERREPWVDLAQYYYDTRNWSGSYYAAIRALSITEKPLEYLCEPTAWGAAPHDLASIAAWNLNIKLEALKLSIDALKLNPTDERLRSNASLVYQGVRKTDVGVVIPCKSNVYGLVTILQQLQQESSVKRICVVADGETAFSNITKSLEKNFIKGVNVLYCKFNSGIHVMWNMGANWLSNFENTHILYANDDIEIHKGAIDSMAGVLDAQGEIGVICPNYDKRLVDDIYVPVYNACPGRYDGTDGLAGFCFLLRDKIAKSWRFDERMKWYYGDNDIVNWVWHTGKKAVISGVSTMKTNPSWTKNNDKPVGFDEATEKDRLIFEEKWSKGV